MTLDFQDESQHKLDMNCQQIAEQVVVFCIDYMICPYECEVSLLLTDDTTIHRLNMEFRQIDRPTDVLSFPMIEYTTPGDFTDVKDNSDCFHPDSGELILGDIVISEERVLAQAEEYGHSYKREFAFLIVHSMLHLFGYDHMEETERIVMEDLQKKIMNKIGIHR